RQRHPYGFSTDAKKPRLAWLVALKYPFGQRSDLSHILFIYSISSTAPFYIELVTPKINQAYLSSYSVAHLLRLFCSNFPVHDNMPGTTNFRQLSENTGSRPRRLARLVAAGVSLKYPTFLISLAYTNSLPVRPASRRRDDGICAQTLIARVASDFCHHTRRLIRCIGADISQGRQDAGVAVVARRLVSSPPYCSYLMRTDPAGYRSWPVDVDVRGRGAEGKQFGSRSTRSVRASPPNSCRDLVRENAYAWLKRVCTTTPTPPSRSTG
ncbi:hypothetical protein EDB83DRAFT_2466800, partial [Lactarius deliciosus]